MPAAMTTLEVPAARVDEPQRPRMRIVWPPPGEDGETDNGFLGIWQPDGLPAITVSAPASLGISVRRGAKWLLASVRSPLHNGDRGLVHSAPLDGFAAAFRGYIVGPDIHSYSDSADILAYWRHRVLGAHNGVFSAAIVDERANTLTLCADLLGFAPMYYSSIAGGVIFATNARYLTTADSTPDLLAWRCLLESGFIGADRGLSSNVRRLAAGQILRVRTDRPELVANQPLEDLPRGDRPLDQAGIVEVERVFRAATRRCVALSGLNTLLPLSSGHDSRRILAALIADKREFQALTCRVFHKGRDLDAHFAAKMAGDFGIPHTIVEAPTPAESARQDRTRRLLTDTETQMHSWVPGFMRALPRRPAMLFDGIAGDILGNPGFRVPGLYRSVAEDTAIILDVSLPAVFDPLLRPRRWPTIAAVREDLSHYLATLPQRVNLAEFAFILLRQRRATAAWSQQLLPPGYVPVCPFLDLEYVTLLLSFVPADKHAVVLQRRCLADFWPDFYRYPGTRDPPAEVSPAAIGSEDSATARCMQLLRSELAADGGFDFLRDLLSPRGRATLTLSRMHRWFEQRTIWHLSTLMELVAREAQSRPCWQIDDP